jgi:hypothetical protein
MALPLTSRPEPTLRSLSIAGGNLFQIAEVYLGDATQWYRIAQLNGLWDFTISSPVTLKIPPITSDSGNGGILGI